MNIFSGVIYKIKQIFQKWKLGPWNMKRFILNAEPEIQRTEAWKCVCKWKRDRGMVRLHGVNSLHQQGVKYRGEEMCAGRVEWLEKKILEWSMTRVSAKAKGKVHKTVVSPPMLFGLVTMALAKRQMAELNIWRFSLGGTRKDRMRNEEWAHPEGRYRSDILEMWERWDGDGVDTCRGGKVNILVEEC